MSEVLVKYLRFEYMWEDVNKVEYFIYHCHNSSQKLEYTLRPFQSLFFILFLKASFVDF